jgi:hypothetical protein
MSIEVHVSEEDHIYMFRWLMSARPLHGGPHDMLLHTNHQGHSLTPPTYVTKPTYIYMIIGIFSILIYTLCRKKWCRTRTNMLQDHVDNDVGTNPSPKEARMLVVAWCRHGLSMEDHTIWCYAPATGDVFLINVYSSSGEYIPNKSHTYMYQFIEMDSVKIMF